ncbi:type ISP restriction/modification enzyme [Amylolactobacillus amylophilus]|uniref:type ISP restriction/modification enzyme n=1 Tax=Amylolactobacillus amylophilus TaxID=1603 RepID=UPI0006D1BFC2|nr:type ISP restriction/modification enzyme [Amylolactobacillus amylophilus]
MQNLDIDSNGDWINKRDINYLNYLSMGNDSSENNKEVLFNDSAIGVTTSRDSWVYGYGRRQVVDNVHRMIQNYNHELKRLKKIIQRQKSYKISIVIPNI